MGISLRHYPTSIFYSLGSSAFSTPTIKLTPCGVYNVRQSVLSMCLQATYGLDVLHELREGGLDEGLLSIGDFSKRDNLGDTLSL